MSTDIASLAIKVDSTQVKKGGEDLSDLARKGATAESSMSGVSSKAALLGNSMKLASIGIASVATALTAALGTLIPTVERIQNLDLRIKGLTKSTEDYAEAQSFLTSLSKEHSKSQLDLTDSFAALLAVEETGVITRQESERILTTLSDAQTKTGATANQLSQSMLGLTQALSSGVVQWEEIKQTTEPIPGLLLKIANAAGFTGESAIGDFKKMASEGKITSKVFGDIVSSIEGYEGAAVAASENITSQYAQVGNAWQDLARTLEQPVSDALTPVLLSIQDALIGIKGIFDGGILEDVRNLAEQGKLLGGVGFLNSAISGIVGKPKINDTGNGTSGSQIDPIIEASTPEEIRAEIEATQGSRGGGRKRGGGRVGKSDAQREAEQAAREYQREKESAIQASQAFVDQLEKENALVGKSAKEKQIYDLDQIGLTLQKKGANQEYIDQVLTAGMQEIDINEKLIQQQKEKEGGTELAKQVKEYATAISDANQQTAEELALFGKTDAQKQLALENLRIERDLKKELQVINESIATQEAKSSAIQVATNAAKTAKLAAQGNVLIEQNHKESEEVQKIWDNAAKNIQSSLANFLFDPFKSGLDGMFNDFANLLRRIAAEQLAAQIMKGFTGENGLFSSLSSGASLFGKAGDAFAGDGALLSKGNTTGLLDGIIGGVSKLGGLFSFASGSPFIPRDGLAMVHRGERVVTAGENANSGNQRAMNITVNVQSGTPDNVRRAAGQGAREALSVMNSAQRYR